MGKSKIKAKNPRNISEKIQIVISYILRFSIIVAIFGTVSTRRWMILFLALLALFLTFLPAILEKKNYISLPTEFEFMFVIFIYASIFLGEVHYFYIKYWWWDLLLHAVSGIILGFAGFIIIYVLYSKNKIKMSPFLVVVFSFSFAVAIGVVWEIFEFCMDAIFGLNMQKSGLVDTMWDLIVDCMGASIASIWGYLYIKFNKGYIVQRLIDKFLHKNPKFS